MRSLSSRRGTLTPLRTPESNNASQLAAEDSPLSAQSNLPLEESVATPTRQPVGERPPQNSDPGLQQLMQQLQGAVPEGPDGGALGGGGKGGLSAADPVANAQAVLASQAPLDPEHDYVAGKLQLKRQMGQLGMTGTEGQPGDPRIHIHDLSSDHGAAITRLVGGSTGIAEGMQILGDWPDMDTTTRDAARADFRKNEAAVDSSFEEVLQSGVQDELESVIGMGETAQLLADRQVGDDPAKTFVNMSYGFGWSEHAQMMTKRLFDAPEGSQLNTKLKDFLGRAPNTQQMADGSEGPAQEDVFRVHQELVYPAIVAARADPETAKTLQTEVDLAGERVLAARERGVMMFQSAGNAYLDADFGGAPELSANSTNGVAGIVTVGATDPRGPGDADDVVSAFSSMGGVELAMRGVRLPVEISPDGNAVDTQGTSFSAPAAVETAAVMARLNPKLSLDEIESLLTDPRVASDIAGDTRDGAGNIGGPDDQFAVLVLAAASPERRASLTRDDIDMIRNTLDANPDVGFNMQFLLQ